MEDGSSTNWCSAWSNRSYSTLSCRKHHSAFTSPRRMTASTLRHCWYCTAATARYTSARPPLMSLRKCRLRSMRALSVDAQHAQLPRRAVVVQLRAQLGLGVEGIDDEQRSLLAHRHGPVVHEPRDDGVVPMDVVERDFRLVVVQRDGRDGAASAPHGSDH